MCAACLLVLPAHAQPSQDVTELVQPVTIKGDVYEQSFSTQPENTCLVRFTVLNTKKGKETVFELNASDLNKRAVSFDTRKNEVTVKAMTQGKRDLIRVYEDGQVEGYQDEVSVLVPGIKEARLLVDALTEMASQCQEQQASADSSSDQSVSTLLSFLEDKVGEVSINDEQFDQAITHDAQNPSIITYERIEHSKGDELQYTVNLTDLNDRSIAFDTKGTAVWVIAETKGKRDLVQVHKNGQLDGYEDQIALMANDIEHARQLEQAWKQLVTLSESETEFLPSNADPSVAETLRFLEEHVGNVEVKDDKYEQAFSYEENTRNGGVGYLLTYQVSDAGKGEEETYHWNMADMHPSSIQFDIQRSNVVVELQTLDKSDLIAYSEDGVLDGYTDGLAIRANSIEEARQLTQAFQHVAKKLNDQPATLSLPTTVSGTLDFLQQRVGEITVGEERFSQSIEAQSDGPCTLSYQIVDGDEGDEFVYEWNMTDLNESSISLNTKGNAVFASVETIGRRDLIEVMENGEVDDYEKQLDIRAAGIEEAREIIAALKQLASLCKTQDAVSREP